jgi:capsular polysaccharide biosynthesis protein
MKRSQKVDFELADYTGVIRRRWRIVIGAIVACLIGAVGYYVTAPKSYTATAVVYVTPTAGSEGNQVAFSRTSGQGINLDTEAALVTSGTVATIAQHLLHTSVSPAELSKLVKIAVPADSQVLDISCSDSTAAGSAACAQAFALAYLQNRSATAASSLSSRMRSLQDKITALQKTVSTLKIEISGLPSNSPARISDQATAASDTAQLHSLDEQLASLTTDLANTSGGHIVTAAAPPGKPSSPDKTIALPAGLVAGLLLGLIGAFVWDRRDTRLHSAQDVERLLGLPVLLNLSRLGREVSLASPRSRTGKAFTELSHTLTASLGEGSHVVLVTGATPGPAASLVAANLAAALARTHTEAVLVCADLRDSIAPQLFGLAGGHGLAEVVAGQATVGEVAHGPAEVPGLWVIPPGADLSLVEYHLQHDTAKALTTQLRHDARYVIIEAQATQDGADTFALADFADTALLTIEADKTRRAQVSDATRRLHRMRIPLLGAALLPPVSPKISIRPPQPSQTRPAPRSALTRPGPRKPPALSTTETSHPADPIPGR